MARSNLRGAGGGMFKKLKIETPFDFMCICAGVAFLLASAALAVKLAPELVAVIAWIGIPLAMLYGLVRIIRRFGWKKVGGVVAVLIVGALALWGVEEYYHAARRSPTPLKPRRRAAPLRAPNPPRSREASFARTRWTGNRPLTELATCSAISCYRRSPRGNNIGSGEA